MQGWNRLDDEAVLTMQEMTPGFLNGLRQGFVSTGGYSLMDGWAKISTPQKLLTYLPRALAIGLLAPFPWQWFDITGFLRAFSVCDMVLLYGLLGFGLIAGVGAILRRDPLGGAFLLAFVTLGLVSMSLVVANMGTLFRLRLQFVLPLLVVLGGGQPLERAQRALARCRRLAASVGGLARPERVGLPKTGPMGD
jgi:hypothetical protein